MTAEGLSLGPCRGGLRAPRPAAHSAAPMTAVRHAIAAAGLALALAACSPASPPPAKPAGSFERSQALIDSGNVAFRAGAFEDAARRYASATVANPDDPAAYYGLGMALAKLGRDDDAREAYAKARALSGAAAADTTVHP